MAREIRRHARGEMLFGRPHLGLGLSDPSSFPRRFQILSVLREHPIESQTVRLVAPVANNERARILSATVNSLRGRRTMRDAVPIFRGGNDLFNMTVLVYKYTGIPDSARMDQNLDQILIYLLIYTEIFPDRARMDRSYIKMLIYL
jgi:hypothetical protein